MDATYRFCYTLKSVVLCVLLISSWFLWRRVINCVGYVAPNGGKTVDDELEMMYKEVVMVHFPLIYLEDRRSA
jgi:hypothetical protein